MRPSSLHIPGYFCVLTSLPGSLEGTKSIEVSFHGRHNMPDDWKDSCRDVLQIFYPEPERLIEAENQLQKLVSNAENGAWSSDVDLFKEIRDKPNQTKLSSVSLLWTVAAGDSYWFGMKSPDCLIFVDSKNSEGCEWIALPVLHLFNLLLMAHCKNLSSNRLINGAANGWR